ncbi:MAG TPA: hypothetical protein VKK79_14465, partial [Candidatus Lokiarchaeia archaeon]|nr:hypothetical protein [Candidatus Lokiarchaeia archaeon]
MLAAFPGVVICICSFHSALLLTRGLLKEFNRIQREENVAFIKECSTARKWSTQRDKGSKEAPPALSDPFCRKWASFYNRILHACAARGLDKFDDAYRSLIRSMR